MVKITGTKPHNGVDILINARPRNLKVKKLAIPMELPMDIFKKEGAEFDEKIWSVALEEAKQYIEANRKGEALILGSNANVSCSSWSGCNESIKIGEELALNSLATEMYVLKVCNIETSEDGAKKYYGRGQYPKFALKPAVHRNFENSGYSCVKCEFWGVLEATMITFKKVYIKLNWKIENEGITARGLADQTMNLVSVIKSLAVSEIPWLGEEYSLDDEAYVLDFIRAPIVCFETIDQTFEVVWKQKCLAFRERTKHLRNSFKGWLTENLKNGAKAAHRAVNVDNAANTKVSKMVYDGEGERILDPQSIVQFKADEWKKYWAPAVSKEDSVLTDIALNEIKEDKCRTVDCLVEGAGMKISAKAYGKCKAAGADHWKATELAGLPIPIWDKFAGSINRSQVVGVWASQLYLVLMAVLGKPTGGERCAGVPKLPYKHGKL